MTPERQEKFMSVLNKRQNDITVVLENIFDPHNISAIMRSCDAVGLQDIYVLNTTMPRHENWGRKSSCGTAKWLTVHYFDNTEECFSSLRKRYSTILTTHLEPDAISLHSVDLTHSIALVFGNEQFGVTHEARSLADGNFMIPQLGFGSSLNVSVACAVTLYEAYRQKFLAGHYKERKLSNEEVQSLIGEWSLKGRYFQLE